MVYESNYISHHGVKGQKWGVRRYQNKNGSLTSEGKRRYGGKEAVKKVNTSKNGNTSKKSVITKIKEKYQSLPSGVRKAIDIGTTVAAFYASATISHDLRDRFETRALRENFKAIMGEPGTVTYDIQSTTVPMDWK